MRAWAPPRQMWVMASASASAASAGLGGESSRRMRVTIAATCALSARPLPDTAALTSLGVCSAMGRPRRAAATRAMPLAWAVPMIGAGVGAGEDALDGHGVGLVVVEPGVDAAHDGDQALGDRGVGAGAQHVDVDERQGSPDAALDHAHAAAGQPRVDPQHAHAIAFRPNRCSHVTLSRGMDQAAYDTRRVATVGGRRQASSSASTSSETSKLANTFCTSSESSSASMRRNTLPALSLSSWTCRSGTNSASAES